jgi:aspartyl-tRNA(Asn)/glutamyl-tRNA(Gln) amidotransferase subunit A
MTRCLDASDRLAGPLNAFASRNSRDRLVSQAVDVDRRRKNGDALRPLDGIPIAVKDVFFTADLPTTASSKAFAGFHPKEDGLAIGKLRAAGALVVGKSQTHELAYGPTTANEYAGPSRNPWNLEHVSVRQAVVGLIDRGGERSRPGSRWPARALSTLC